LLPTSTLKSILKEKHHRLSAVVACARNHVIGLEGKMPWHCPADLAHFKQLTLKKDVIMGRKTMESIGRPLPHRRIVVLSHTHEKTICGCPVIADLGAWLQNLPEGQEIMVAGGAQIYNQLLPLCTSVYQTIIEHDFQGDVFFPPLDLKVWKLVDSEPHQADSQNPHDYHFLQYERQ
jgi:dihydrofolate reductase